MNLLINKLPLSLSVRGSAVPINTDFRASMRYEVLTQDPDKTNEEKLIETLSIYFGEDYTAWPEITAELIDQIAWFHRGGADKGEKKRQAKTNGKIPYSFEVDSDLIQAAFLQQYDLDLCEVEYLHWWKFRALFKGLGKDCEICRIMGYRTMRITSKMSKEERAFYQEMQSRYEVKKKLSGDEIQLQKDLEEALLHGGDITEILSRR